MPLKALPSIAVTDGPGGFDWMLVDRAQNRLYATHGGTKTLTVLDLKTNAVRQIAAGDVAGVAVDAPDGKVFTGGGDQKVVVLDSKTLTKIGKISFRRVATASSWFWTSRLAKSSRQRRSRRERTRSPSAPGTSASTARPAGSCR